MHRIASLAILGLAAGSLYAQDLRKALDLYRTNQCPQAIPYLNAVAEHEPANDALRKMLASCLVRTGDIAQGRAQFKAVLDRNPSDLEAKAGWTVAETLFTQKKIPARGRNIATAKQRLAEKYSSTERYSEAAALYRELSQRKGSSEELKLRYAQNLSWAKRYAESIAAYKVYLERNTGDTEAMLALANVTAWSGRIEDAVAAYRTYLKMKPQDQTAQSSLRQAEQYLRNLANASKGTGQAADPILTAAYARMENQDLAGALRYFIDYSEKHPDNVETVLQIARLYSWNKQYAEADTYYLRYLEQKPTDKIALREAAVLSMTIPNFAFARVRYAKLIGDGEPTITDYEGLVHAYTWDGNYSGAQPFAKQLAAMDSGNHVAHEALQTYFEQQKRQGFQRARQYNASQQYPQAIEQYKSLLTLYGPSAEAELALCRLYARNKQTDESISAYRSYLQDNPKDTLARIELANVSKWDKRYDDARSEYEAVLKVESNNAQALLGLAQVSDYEGRNAFEVLKNYKLALAADISNRSVRDRAKELAAAVSPSVGYSQQKFGDSDGFSRSSETLESSYALSGKIRLNPFYRFESFEQQNGESLSSQTSGLKFNGSDDRMSYSGELGYTRFSAVHGRFSVKTNFVFRLAPGRVIDFGYAHVNAAYELNTLAVVKAGVANNSFLLGYRQSLAAKWKFSALGGFSRYSASAASNIQPRFSAKIDRPLFRDLTGGFEMRMSGFRQPNPLYFSPSLYQTYGFVYHWDHKIHGSWNITADGDIDGSRISREHQATNVLEMAIVPAIEWHARPGLVFRLGYRFSRGSSSASGSPVYSTSGLDFGVNKLLMQPLR